MTAKKMPYSNLNYFKFPLKKDNDHKIKDFLKFVAAVDWVPITGFSKPNKVYFADKHIFKVSPWGLTIILPLNIIFDMLNFEAIIFLMLITCMTLL